MALPIGMGSLVAAAPFSQPGADGTPSPAPATCARGALDVTVAPGTPVMGRADLVIQVSNDGRRRCDVSSYPSVLLVGPTGGQVGAATKTANVGVRADERTPPFHLSPGETASALLSGSDRPLGGATSCPALSAYAVEVAPSERRVFGGPLPDCAGFAVSPFVPGFIGTSPSGEVSGRTPACAGSGMTSRPGPFVRIGALSGHTLVGSISVAVGSRRSERFTLALPPGRYRISSPPASPREVRVRPGRITHVGLFGACTTPPATVTTIPVAGGGSTTTSTLPASDIASAPRCTTADLAVSALKFEAGLGNVAEWIAFKNVGETLCTLTGYPGVAALDGRGVQVQQARRSVAAYLGGLGPYLEPPTVPLEPGQVATATVDGSDNPVGGTSCPYFPALLVTVPDETGSIVLEGVGWQGPTFSAQGFPGCAPLTVTPVVPGDSGRYP